MASQIVGTLIPQIYVHLRSICEVLVVEPERDNQHDPAAAVVKDCITVSHLPRDPQNVLYFLSFDGNVAFCGERCNLGAGHGVEISYKF